VCKKDEANFCVSTSPRLFEITKVVPWSAATGLVQYVLL
jgi:hypothetical protein